MIRHFLFLTLGFCLFGAPDARALDCETVTFEGTAYDTCSVDLRDDDLRLWWAGPDGQPLLAFGEIARQAAQDGLDLAFAMNAGMYHEDRGPVGHLIIDGQEHMRVVTSAGPGNFGMVPNGIFCWGKDKARVVESRAYAKAQPKCRYATQSGPMLVLDGKLHPRFLADSPSLRLRNGVGVRKDGHTVIFAITRSPVNFHSFARFFRDRMDTPDALYLDGSISRIYAPSLGRRGLGGRFGPMLGVVVPQ